MKRINIIVQKTKEKIAFVFNFFLLSMVYVIGIGFTSIVARILGKSFLFGKNKKQSNFIVFKKTNDLEKMF